MRNLRADVLAYADVVAESEDLLPAEVAWRLRSLAGEQCSERLCTDPPEEGYTSCERHTQEAYMREYG